MFCWEVPWPLILGFARSDAVQAVVSKQEMRRLPPDDSPRWLGAYHRPRHPLFLVLLSAERARPLALALRRLLHGRDGISVCLARLGAELLVAVALPRAPLDAGQVLGPTENAPGRRARLEDRRGQEPRLRAPLATTGNEPADSAAHSPRPA